MKEHYTTADKSIFCWSAMVLEHSNCFQIGNGSDWTNGKSVKQRLANCQADIQCTAQRTIFL